MSAEWIGWLVADVVVGMVLLAVGDWGGRQRARRQWEHERIALEQERKALQVESATWQQKGEEGNRRYSQLLRDYGKLDDVKRGLQQVVDSRTKERDEARAKLAETERRFEALLAERGAILPDQHPDEAKPRAQTWLHERANWEAEVRDLRGELKASQHLARIHGDGTLTGLCREAIAHLRDGDARHTQHHGEHRALAARMEQAMQGEAMEEAA